MELFDIPEHIDRYAEAHSSPEDQVLYDLYRETYLKTVHPQMVSGRVQGQFLAIMSKMIRPRHILEIGTFTGYSAYCLSKGLQKSGKITTIEVNEELEEMIQQFFQKAGIAQKTELIIGDALKLLAGMDQKFDLIFLDANKEHYPNYYNICIDKLNVGGYMIADNVLWSGKVAKEQFDDQSTKKLREFNDMVQKDKRVENVFLTIRDGLSIIRKQD
ncbi:MAG TPA: O-methyltransferase [Bacteroidales bacterium]|nr:O-methyltransferase [Bacteroidales bacterium]